MRIVVLLSVGTHPVSRRPCPVKTEAQAIRLAGIGHRVIGLHAGSGDDPVGEYLGHGLTEIVTLDLPAGSDPTAALVAELKALNPSLVLAGRRGQGGEDTGLLPYQVAAGLGWPIVADACGIAAADGGFEVEQALPRGERRFVTVASPVVVTVHPAAPPAHPFVYAAARRGTVEVRPGLPVPETPSAADEQPYRRRPRLIRKVSGGGGEVLVDPAPELAAAKIIEFLEQIGVLER